MIIVAIVVVFMLAFAFVFFGMIADKFLLPKDSLQVGDTVQIFIDGIYNRAATITGITADKIYIYDTLPLPLDYRGRFYGIGTDIDGVEFWYLKYRKRNYMVRFAEFVRIHYDRLNDPYQLEPVTSESDLLTAAQKQKCEYDKMHHNTDEDES